MQQVPVYVIRGASATMLSAQDRYVRHACAAFATDHGMLETSCRAAYTGMPLIHAMLTATLQQNRLEKTSAC